VEFIQIIALVVYFGTPLFIVYAWVRLAKSHSREVAWPMATALGLWLLQAGVLLYFIAICISGHCTLTPVEENAPAVLLGVAYLGIAWLLWFAWRQRIRTAART
jgi:heme/copper-type cytochrome/quinol oxidase subunit 1